MLTLELLCKRVLDLELLDFTDIHSLVTILKPEYKEEFVFLNFFHPNGAEQKARSLFWAHLHHKYIIHEKKHLHNAALMYTECSHGFNIFIANPKLYKELFLRPIRRGPFAGIYILKRPLKLYVTEIKSIRGKTYTEILYND